MDTKKNNPDYPYKEQTVKIHKLRPIPGGPVAVGEVIAEIPYSEYKKRFSKNSDYLDNEDDYEWFTQHGDD